MHKTSQFYLSYQQYARPLLLSFLNIYINIYEQGGKTGKKCPKRRFRPSLFGFLSYNKNNAIQFKAIDHSYSI